MDLLYIPFDDLSFLDKLPIGGSSNGTSLKNSVKLIFGEGAPWFCRVGNVLSWLKIVKLPVSRFAVPGAHVLADVAPKHPWPQRLVILLRHLLFPLDG